MKTSVLYRRRRQELSALPSAALLLMVWGTQSYAATVGPPLLDINHQCSLNSRRNVTAMSECIVAESEARAEILQKWHKVPDASAERCVKLGRKNQKYPYTTIAKCLAEPAVPATAPATPSTKTTGNKAKR